MPPSQTTRAPPCTRVLRAARGAGNFFFAAAEEGSLQDLCSSARCCSAQCRQLAATGCIRLHRRGHFDIRHSTLRSRSSHLRVNTASTTHPRGRAHSTLFHKVEGACECECESNRIESLQSQPARKSQSPPMLCHRQNRLIMIIYDFCQ